MALAAQKYTGNVLGADSDGKPVFAGTCLQTLTAARHEALLVGAASDGRPVFAAAPCATVAAAARRLAELVGVASDGRPVFAASCCPAGNQPCVTCPGGLPARMYVSVSSFAPGSPYDGTTLPVDYDSGSGFWLTGLADRPLINGCYLAGFVHCVDATTMTTGVNWFNVLNLTDPGCYTATVFAAPPNCSGTAVASGHPGGIGTGCSCDATWLTFGRQWAIALTF